jgi:hypothetical protein
MKSVLTNLNDIYQAEIVIEDLLDDLREIDKDLESTPE